MAKERDQMENIETERMFENRARDGDAGFAIAYALLQVSANLDKLGFNDRMNGHGGSPGTTEKIGMELAELVASMRRVQE